jgi:triacylglycerol lipase
MATSKLNAPIVLAHGLLGFREIAVGRLTLAKYFRGVPEFLRASGNRVVATHVPAIAGLDRRARRLAEEIDAAFPGEPVHIIGHSSGGLDARWLLTEGDWSRRVLSLTAIATPHLGTAIADFAKLRFGRVYAQLSGVGIDPRGLVDITRRGARAFQRRARVPRGVACFSVAGNPREEEVSWPLRRLHAALMELEGPNDAIVSVESALAFGTPLPSLPLDHLRQMNWMIAGAPEEPSPALAMYDDVVRNLARHGFGDGEVAA